MAHPETEVAGAITSRVTAGTGAGSETYRDDQADQLTSWTKGSTSTSYG